MLRKSQVFVIGCALLFATPVFSRPCVNAQEGPSEIAAGSSDKRKSAVRELTERVLRIERQLAIDSKKKPGPKIQVWPLENARAEEMVTTLSPLFAWDPTTIIVFDGRTNSVVARGSESELQILEALLLRFDEIPNPKGSPPAQAASVPRVGPRPAISALEPANLDAPLPWPVRSALNDVTVGPAVTRLPVTVDVDRKLTQRILSYKQHEPVSRRILMEALQEQLGAAIRYDNEDLGTAELETTVTFELENTTVGGVIKSVADAAGWEMIVEAPGLRLKRKQKSSN